MKASADASAEGLSPEFAGGQVARGGRAGVLGTRDNMDTPFSITSYTNRLMQSQQARSVADVVQNDPAVRTARGFGNFQETFFIRGFLTVSDDIAYNGLFGLLPRQYTAVESVERVEVLRGASAFLYGAAPSGGGIGGTINVLPKRADDEPLSQLTVGTASGSQLYTAADIGRRFGPDNSTGVRINLARRDGDTAVDDEKVSMNLFNVGVDWRGEQTRLSADLGFQEYRLKGIRPNVTLAEDLTAVPDAPSNKLNYAQPWTVSNEHSLFGTVRAEHDLSDTATLWAALGAKRGKEFNSLASPTVSDATSGDASFTRFDNRRQDDVKTGEVGFRGTFDTGAVSHRLVASVSHFEHKEKNAVAMGLNTPLDTNIYDPINWLRPDFAPGSFIGNDLKNPSLTNRTRLTSFTLGDTLSFLDDRVELTVGLRHQQMRHVSYEYFTGEAAGENSQKRTSPVAGVVFKVRDDISLYANYIESLAQGDTAPATQGGNPVLNGGQRLSPYVSKQKEIGIKYDGGRLGAGLALFTTSKPRAFVNDELVYEAAGKDRHSGAELTVYGEISEGLRLLGGLTYLEAKQRSTGDAASDGKRVIGVPRLQANLGLDWDVPAIEGLSLSTRVIATGSRYANAQNTLRAPGWVRVDLGANYLTDVGGTPVTFRLQVENVANRDYWSSVGGYPNNGYLVLGNPRTLMLNASMEF